MCDLSKTPVSLEKNSRVTIVKTAIKPGEESNVKKGTRKTGTLAAGIQKGNPIEFRNPERSGSYPVSTTVLNISKQGEKTIVETKTSYYEVN